MAVGHNNLSLIYRIYLVVVATEHSHNDEIDECDFYTEQRNEMKR